MVDMCLFVTPLNYTFNFEVSLVLHRFKTKSKIEVYIYSRKPKYII